MSKPFELGGHQVVFLTVRRALFCGTSPALDVTLALKTARGDVVTEPRRLQCGESAQVQLAGPAERVWAEAIVSGAIEQIQPLSADVQVFDASNGGTVFRFQVELKPADER